jgi:hypothetical protein
VDLVEWLRLDRRAVEVEATIKERQQHLVPGGDVPLQEHLEDTIDATPERLSSLRVVAIREAPDLVDLLDELRLGRLELT